MSRGYAETIANRCLEDKKSLFWVIKLHLVINVPICASRPVIVNFLFLIPSTMT